MDNSCIDYKSAGAKLLLVFISTVLAFILISTFSIETVSAKAKKTHKVTYSNFYSKKEKNKKGQWVWKTYITTKYSFTWKDGYPLCRYRDTIAATTSSKKFNVVSKKGYVTYCFPGIDKTKKKKLSVKTKNSGTGVYASFDVRYLNDPTTQWWSKKGYITITWKADGKINQVGVSGNYGHAKVDLTPGVSFGGGASIGFTPVKKVDFGAEKYRLAEQ